MSSLIAASVFFLAIHFGVSGTRLRDVLTSRMGEGPYRGMFSLASIVGIVWMSMAYSRAPAVELWGQLIGLRPLASALVLLAFLFAGIGLVTPSPTGIGMESRLTQGGEIIRGMVRITRHPFLWGVALWALAHTIVNGDLPSLIFFGSLLLLALGGTLSIDAKRRRHCGEAWERFVRETSNVPFAAIVAGRNRLVPALREIGLWRPLIAIIAYALLLVLHGRLFGMPLV
ncbi:hypothetical protein ACG33_04200 [Steroidobacter denitrificans]|uniref:NnrU domain-containing protein n=1 Tax=Steroidobacter denitrificans TaxID=465721 RepID=A0A127F9K8_STEDE|nr:NnrU family protein [Steroidobacter denitrificans]AMN46321.1 hypothetical protein ACG33_04200 [Steroidobacter denitrificans]